MNRTVFFISSALIVLITALGALGSQEVGSYVDVIQSSISRNFGWFYLMSMTSFLLFMVYIGTSKYGVLRLGAQDEKPEFSTWSWLAMLFSAGMGIGLLFYSVAEPIMHFSQPAPFLENFDSSSAHRYAMALTFFHWGVHPWACYALVGLAASCC